MSRIAAPCDSRNLDVLCAGALREIVTELVRAFEPNCNHKISVAFDRSGRVKNRALNGESADVVITTEAAIDELARARKIVPGSAATLARSAIGVAVRAGAAKPDIGSVDSFKRALLGAKTIACADPATGSPSANHFVALLGRLAITGAIEPKLRLISAGPDGTVVVCEAVAAGEAEIGIQQISEILAVPGVDLIGPLPDELQLVTVFSGAVSSSAKEPALARRFIKFASSEAADRK
jgi:molybdate transport system substrate-binding protein